MSNKVKFGLTNVHYAVITEDSSGNITYGTPVAIPGAVNMSMDAEGEINNFYADNSAYFKQAANNGYSGELEIARIPDSFRTDVLQEVDSNGVAVEKNDAIIKSFALGYEINGDSSKEKYWMLNCTVTRPSSEAATVEDTITPKTDKLKFTATADKSGRVITHTTDSTKATDINNWFTKVIVEGSTSSK